MPENPEPPPPLQPLPPAPPSDAARESQARTWHMLCHLSALAGGMIPFANVIGPLVIWQIKKEEFPSIEAHAKAAMNFQLTVLIAVAVSGILGVLLSVVCVGFLFIAAAIGLGIASLVFSVIAGIKANEGKEFRYPYSLNLIK